MSDRKPSVATFQYESRRLNETQLQRQHACQICSLSTWEPPKKEWCNCLLLCTEIHNTVAGPVAIRSLAAQRGRIPSSLILHHCRCDCLMCTVSVTFRQQCCVWWYIDSGRNEPHCCLSDVPPVWSDDVWFGLITHHWGVVFPQLSHSQSGHTWGCITCVYKVCAHVCTNILSEQ